MIVDLELMGCKSHNWYCRRQLDGLAVFEVERKVVNCKMDEHIAKPEGFSRAGHEDGDCEDVVLVVAAVEGSQLGFLQTP